MRNTKLTLCLFFSTLFCQLLALQVALPLAASSSPYNNNPSSCIDNEVNIILDDFDHFSDKSIVQPVVDVGVRGGGSAAAVFDDVGVDTKTRDVILRFLHTKTNKNKGTKKQNGKFVNDDTFHIQGWRWHFMSLIRDSKRLERLSSYLANSLLDETWDATESTAGLDALHRAATYVVNFNMAGLYRIQSGMFLSFLREHLCDNDSFSQYVDEGGDDDVTAEEIEAFRKVIDTIDDYRIQSENIGRELVSTLLCTVVVQRAATLKSPTLSTIKHHPQYELAKAVSISTSSQQKKQLLDDIIHSSRKLVDQLSLMRQIQETLIVPAIARVVPPKVQKSFNNRVLLNLGVFESRLHLVGMHDAVWESELDAEMKAFESEIPYVARMMIERWRQSLYIPKAGALDYGLAKS